VLSNGNLVLLDETKVVDLGRDVTAVVSRVTILGFFLGDSGQQKDGTLERGRARTVGHENILVVVGPVGGGGNGLLIRQLQGLDAADNLIHIASDASGVVEREHKLVFRVDDKDGTNGQGQSLIFRSACVDHTIGHANRAIGVSDDRELDFDLVLAMGNDIAEPVVVRLDGIHGEGGDKAVHGREFVLLHRQTTNLGGADWRKVSWVGKQNGPLSLLPRMERIPFTLGGVACKVGDNVAQTDAYRSVREMRLEREKSQS
jgi:hypothetical protein